MFGAVLLSGGSLWAQAETDTLYNPFPLANAAVPYRPVSFGTGLPERLKSDEAVAAIRRAFKASGIDLAENVWVENDEVGVYLDGYNEENEIGFLFIDYQNMDGSFRINSSSGKTGGIGRLTSSLQERTDGYLLSVQKAFAEFLNDKEEYVKRWGSHAREKTRKEYAKKLAELPAVADSEQLFNQYRLEYDLADYRRQTQSTIGLKKRVIEEIERRFPDTVTKFIALRSNHQLNLLRRSSAPFVTALSFEFDRLSNLEDDEEFVTALFSLNRFIGYHSGTTSLLRDADYLALKTKIVENHPINEWFEHLGLLDDYKNRHFISLDEARQIDEDNKKGDRFIAPISLRDPAMIIPGTGGAFWNAPSPFTEEAKTLTEEFRLANGMTPEILNQKRKEQQEVSSKYSWQKMRGLPAAQRDSMERLRQEATRAIEIKYAAMEKLTAEEKAVFMNRFKDLSEREQEWRKANRDTIRQQTLIRLEEQVKRYIKWAKSQMGG